MGFAAAAITDTLDGRIARSRGEVSSLGVFMDLTADKVLVAGVLVAMVEVRLLPTWIVALILIRELVIAGVRQLAASVDVVMAAGMLGKSKTTVTHIGMVLLLLAFDAQTLDRWRAGWGDALGRSDSGRWCGDCADGRLRLGYLRAAWPILSGDAGA